METKTLETRIEELDEKLSMITDYIQRQERRQREMDELKADLTHIGKDVFQTAVTELDEVAHHFDTSDLLYLLKKLLRNTRNLSGLADQIESASDFLKDATPLSRQIFSEILESLSELEKKGYFEFAREMLKIVDTVVTTFTVDDARLLRENIINIINTFRNLTQPQMLSSVDNALHFFREMDVNIDQKISYWEIMKELRDPEMKRGLTFAIRFMKNMVRQNGGSQDIISQKNTNESNQTLKED